MFGIFVCIIICAVVLYLLVKMLHDKSHAVNKCIVPIRALVVDVDILTASDLGKSGDALWYKPVLLINLNNEEIRISPRLHSDLRQFLVGDSVPIMINPENPMEFYYNDGVTRDYKSKVLEFGELVKSQLKG